MHYSVLTLPIIISGHVLLRVLFVYRLSSLKNYPLFIRVLLPGFFHQWLGHHCETNLPVWRFIKKKPTVFFSWGIIFISWSRLFITAVVTLVLFIRVFLLHTSTMLTYDYWQVVQWRTSELNTCFSSSISPFYTGFIHKPTCIRDFAKN